MQLSKMKNIIVLKGMASNVVEEAIVVLKPNVKIQQNQYNGKSQYSSEEKNKKMILMKEAETTINTYVKKLQNKTNSNYEKNLKMKCKFLQVCNVVLIISIVIGALLFL